MFTIKITLLFLPAFFHDTDKLLVLAISDVTQNVYHINFERAQVVWFDKTVYENFEIVTYKYNRTVASYNLTSTLRIDVPSFKVNYRCYKFSVNEYKLTAIQFEANGCALLKFGKLGAKSLMINSNFTDCPLKRGTYGLYNANIDSSTFPPHFPEGKWKFRLNQEVNKAIVFKLDFYISVVYPVKYGRK